MSLLAWMILASIPGFFGGAVIVLRRRAIRARAGNAKQKRLQRTFC